MQKIYRPDKIFTGEQWLDNHVLITEDGVIKDISPVGSKGFDSTIVFNGGSVIPAFIDLQIYGANKKLLAVHPTVDALSDLHQHNKNGGTVLCQPTVATNSIDVFKRSIDAVRQYWKEGGKGVIGLHLEGPWIAVEKKGAHLEEFITKPSLKDARALLEYGKGVVTMITLAPEVCSEEVIRLIQSYNVVISAGHSNANYEQAMQALDKGIPTITHLYNAMSALQHRGPGLVGAAFQHSIAKASIIPDGYHVDFAAISIAKKIMGDRLFVITDAVTETSEGGYPHQMEGDKYVSNGILSGSALTMHKAVVNLVNKAGVSLEEAIRMCSLYPAQLMKLDNKFGKIAPGYSAQFVVLNQALDMLDVIIE